jgi:hypothetical protein
LLLLLLLLLAQLAAFQQVACSCPTCHLRQAPPLLLLLLLLLRPQLPALQVQLLADMSQQLSWQAAACVLPAALKAGRQPQRPLRWWSVQAQALPKGG